MPDLYDLIKRISVQAVESKNPAGLAIGKVLGMSPVRIQVDQRLDLEAAFLIIPPRVAKELEVGKGVLLLREQGGQRYAVLDIL